MFPQSDDYRFFKAIEAEFIRLRITPLQLSPDDFRIAKEWRAASVPLELALEVLGEKIAGQREKGQEVKRRLSYYRKAVLSAWEKRRELLAPGTRTAVPTIDLAAELASIASALPPPLALLAMEIRSLEGDPATVEAALEMMEGRAFELLRESLAPAELDGLQREVEAATAELRQRLPADQLLEVKRSLERQLLRRQGHLPVFSIFSS